ncbi:MAG TPA: choice-of-anchor D domain-containing protein [Methylomirabilota bacterium]|nr:choice-of-anchor D domain-containing protein [Methylomirabilota bacterium]
MSSFVLSLIVAASTGAPALAAVELPDPPPIVRHQLEEGAAKRAAHRALADAGLAGTKSWADPQPPVGYDVEHYDLDLHLDPSRQILSGTVTATLTATEAGLVEVALDADPGLRVLSVMQVADGRFPYDTPRPLAFSHLEGTVTVALARPLDAGEETTLQVAYGGHASRPGLIGSTGVNWYSSGGVPVIHTFAQPYGARVWWPCNDRPDDKATVTLRVTVPEGLDVASNGLERSYVDNGDGTSTAVWSSAYPVPTYLVVMHISDFVHSESTYTALDGSTTMPVGLWAMPPVAAQAEADLAVTPEQIGVLASHWGEYPFLEEKYGNATVFFGGGMEHQTMTTLSVYYVGDPWMEWLNVHELGHQWWGDWVTMDDWRDTWLNEGFATHCEWLWAEHKGPDVLAQYLLDEDYLGQFRGPLYDNPEPFSWTIYAKGSWVAWMLRGVIGDVAFFDAMAAYRAANAGATGTTDELKAAMETASGTDLDWFFDQWVYGLYRPRYVYEWRNAAGPALELTVRQVQTNTGLYRMPVEVRVTTTSGAEDHRVWLEAEAEQTVSIPLGEPAVAVELDPDTRVLAETAHVSEPDLELGPLFPDGYDFGVVLRGTEVRRPLPLTNVGGADLVIEAVLPPASGGFAVDGLPDLPHTLAPGESLDLEVVFSPVGPGRQSTWFTIVSNDPDRDGAAYVNARAVGALYEQAFLAAPPSASVGRVPLGGVGEASFDALNLGSVDLPLETDVTGDGFILGRAPRLIPAGAEAEVVVRYQPTAVGPASGSVIFHTGDPSSPLHTVTLSATADGAPRLELSPAALSLGVGDGSATASVGLANTGTEDLLVSVAAAEPPFTVVNPEVLPATVPAGSAVLLEVGLDPGTAPGTLAGHLVVHSDDPGLPVARAPLRAHVVDGPVVEASYAAAARGPGLGDARWSTTAFLLNPGDVAIRTDIVFRPGDQRSTDAPDAGFEVPPRSQRVIRDLVGAAGASGTGGVNLRSSAPGLVATSRTFALDGGATYGQAIAATDHAHALEGGRRYLLAGLAGNGGFRTNVGVLNLGGEPLTVDLWFFDSSGAPLGSRRLAAQPGAFAQIVAVLSKLTVEVVRGGYATLTAAEPGARFLAYASVVDDASHDPTLALTEALGALPAGVDLVVPAAASLAGANGTRWRTVLDVVNAAELEQMVTVEYLPETGPAVASFPMAVAPGAVLRFEDVVGGLFGSTGKGWLRVSAPEGGVHVASRTFNDDPSGTFGQLIPATPVTAAFGADDTAVLAGLTSQGGFRTNLGLTSVSPEATTCTVAAFADDGTELGELQVDLPAQRFVQIERVLADGLGFTGTAWATVRCAEPAAFLAHASVVDGATGDPTFVAAARLDSAP